MALTNQTIGSGGISGGTWTIQSTNTASVGRYHDLAFMLESGSGGVAGRAGTFPGPPSAGTDTPNAFAAGASGALSLFILPGAAAVSRNAGGGPYIVTTQVNGAVTLGTADATNPRIDRVDIQVFDGALADNGGVSLTRFLVTPGLAAGVPTIPAAPTNSTPVCNVNLPANTTVITSGMISDARKSTGVRGGVRSLLKGDALADVGVHAGELRDTTALPGGVPSIDRWRGSLSAWENLLEYHNGTWHSTDGAVGGNYRITNASAIGTSENGILQTPVVPLEANTLYRVKMWAKGATASAPGILVTLSIRKNAVNGTLLVADDFVVNSASHGNGYLEAMYPTTSAENTSFFGTAVTGSGTIVFNPHSNIEVHKVGSTSMMTSV